jgi:membrane-bound serine protease (ClpP class)
MSTWLGLNLSPVLAVLARPDVAYVLLVVGIIGVLVELSLPGFGVPGVLGGITIFAAMIGFLNLATNPVGLLLILLAAVLFIIDLKTATHGILTGAGLVSFVIGSIVLFPARSAPGLAAERLSPWTIAGMTLLLAGLFAAALVVGLRAMRRPPAVGREALLGANGTAVTDLAPRGQVHVAGEQWSATAEDGPIGAGEAVEVTGHRGLTLTVRRVRT